MTTPARPSIRTVVVGVPAHDEAERIGACCAALERAAATVADDVDVRLVVALDTCRDDTAARLPPGVEGRPLLARNVGAARAHALADAGVSSTTWLCTTDADSEVPPDWIAAQLDRARTADAFVGTVRIDDWSGWTREVAAAHTAAYRPADGHPHVHGANLGVRASAYAAVGGFSALAAHEDHDLVDRLAAAGYCLDRSAAAPVTTSARRHSRTPLGFSGHLRDLEATATPAAG